MNMIKSSELRIGNLVYLKSKNKVYEISSGHDIDEIESSGDAEPIPVDEKTLVDLLGFVKQPLRTKHGNGQDWQPSYPREEYQDYILSNGYVDDRITVTFSTFIWKSKDGTINRDDPSMRGYVGENEWGFRFDHRTVHMMQNVIYFVWGKELTIKKP